MVGVFFYLHNSYYSPKIGTHFNPSSYTGFRPCRKMNLLSIPDFLIDPTLNCLSMKTLYVTSAFLFLVLIQFGMIGKTKLEKAISNFDLEKPSSSDVVIFLVNSSDLHLMALKEGEEAVSRGTVADIKAYGELMVKDQTALLLEIKELAKSRQINIPEQLSEENAVDLEELRSKTGVAFNKAFIRMIESVQKQNLKDFKKAATRLEDREISTFASKHIYSINLQLLRLEKIKAKM